MKPKPKRALSRFWRAAVREVGPASRIAAHLGRRNGVPVVTSKGRVLARLDSGPIRIVAAGKAAVGMARAAARVLGDRRVEGVVVAPRVPRSLPAGLVAFRGGHPLPDGGSLAAGHAVWRLSGKQKAAGTLLVLLSGGASSLLVLPASGVTLADKIRTNELLLRSGASIAEINAVRKHLSLLKGGGLARRAAPGRVVCLYLSDVIGSSAAVVGSGPAAPDPTTFATCLAVLDRYGLERRVPSRVRKRLEAGARGEIDETPKPGEVRSRHLCVGDVGLALEAAAREAAREGFVPRILTTSLRGDTRRAARRLAREILGASSGTCLLSGGETTVRVRGKGKGGRNQELALALAREIAGRDGIAVLSAGSDGRDGPTDAAGAFADGTTMARARRLGLDPAAFLRENDSHRFFARLGDLFRPGLTGTNVMDIQIALVGEPGRGGRTSRG